MEAIVVRILEGMFDDDFDCDFRVELQSRIG